MPESLLLRLRAYRWHRARTSWLRQTAWCKGSRCAGASSSCVAVWLSSSGTLHSQSVPAGASHCSGQVHGSASDGGQRQTVVGRQSLSLAWMTPRVLMSSGFSDRWGRMSPRRIQIRPLIGFFWMGFINQGKQCFISWIDVYIIFKLDASLKTYFSSISMRCHRHFSASNVSVKLRSK